MDTTAILVCLLISVVLAFIVTGVMKGQLKTVRSQSDAGSYIRPGSMMVTASEDIFLYRNVTRTPRPKDNKK